MIMALAPRPAAADTDDYGAWLAVLGQGSFAAGNPDLGRLRWWFDGQARFLDDSDGYDQSILRPGIGYALTDAATLWLGYAYIHTDPGVGDDFDEHRIWQQLLWSGKIEPIELQSRTRLEQRFVENGSDTGWRLRQLLKATYAFGFDARLGLVAYDELFFDLNDTDWGADSGFAQNRLFAGVFWKLGRKGIATAEIGYLNQLISKTGRSDRVNHIASITLLLSFN